jgi:hypothetical protein
MKLCQNVRFIERNYLFQKIRSEQSHLNPLRIEEMLDEASTHYADYTFKFYDNGTVVIIDNHTNLFIKPRELKDVALDFYIRKRISLIKESLQEKQLQLA